MEFWQSIARTEASQLAPVAQLAERLGFAGVTMADHLVRPLSIRSRYPYATGGKMATDDTTPYLDPWVLSVFLARITKRLRFMPYVYIPALRDPFSVAKAISTAALLADDRVLVGIGVGWMEEEFELVGRAFRDRGRRTDELMAVVHKLFEGGMVEHHGEFYDFEPVQMSPLPVRPPPVLVGGHSQIALRRAAASDGWLGVNYDLEEVISILETLAELRREKGRESQRFEAALALNAPPELDDLRRLGDAGVTMILNPPALRPSGEMTSLDEKRANLEAFAERYIEPLER
ncbi:MAG: TIGR03619 family F420-dependent LLM class oxidoreductase [Deltaproteobacteria bacterium]|nr:TIGR03619 family F420-dependent LLM class oxidoreductase [Deltaproteobacteria bacterium]